MTATLRPPAMPLPPPAEPVHSAWHAQTRWRVVGFLAVAAALNYADRSAMSSVLVPLRASFALNDVQLGLLGSVFLWSYALASPIAGTLADRWPRHRLVAASLVTWSAITVLIGLADGWVMLVTLRAALGVAESLYLPSATALIATHHGTATRGWAMSLHSMGLNLGVVIGGAFAGYVADHFGWRAGFWVLGTGGLLLATAAPRVLATDGASPDPVVRPAADWREAWRYLSRVPSFYVLLAKAMLAGVGVWTFLNWLPLYLRETFNFSLGEAGFAGTFLLQGFTLLGFALGGWLSDRVAAGGSAHRMLVQGLAYLAAAPFLLLFLLQPNFVVLAAAVAVFSLLRGIGQANENPTLCDVVPAPFRSTAIGLMNTVATAAAGVGVLTAGVLKSTLGLGAVFAGISLLFVIAGTAPLIAYFLWMRRDIERANQWSRPTPFS